MEYTWSMRCWRALMFIFFALVGPLLSACSKAGGESRIIHAVESTQAAVIQPGSSSNDPQTLDRPLNEVSAEDIDLPKQVAEEEKPLAAICEHVDGRIQYRSYPGYLSGDPIPVIVYLPPCYDPTLQVYPVIFLLHGKPQDERHWLLLGVEEIVTQGILGGKWPPLILVQPQQPEPLFSQTDGGPGSLEKEILQGLIPFILDRYAITSEGERWAIAGISRGGVWSLELGLHNPDQFQNVAALSPALNVNHARPTYDPFQMLADTAEVPAKIFLGAGDDDSARVKTQELASIIEALGIHHRYLEVAGGHESITWTRLIPEMFSFLTQDW